MSEVQQPIAEPVVAAVVETPVVVAVVEPVAESKPVEEAVAAPVVPATEEAAAAPAVETAPVATEEVVAPVEEVKPIEEGQLGYKGPGLLKSLIFQKNHFWFGSEPVEAKGLASYLRGEKPELANHNASWASHTGKGLLFFSKKSGDKASPAGVINLSDASDVTSEGTLEFFFTALTQKHTFKSSTVAERDSWVAALKTKIVEAKESKESVTGSDAYKNTHSSLSKPVVAGIVAGSKAEEKEEKKEEKAEAKEEKKEEKEEKKEIKEEKKEEKAEAKEEKKEEKKARKSRSASRKRNSIFGSIGFGKKEEAPAAAATEETSAPVETAPIVENVDEAPAAVEPVEPVAPVEEARPAPSKRNSIFGTLQSKFAPKEKKTEEAAPAVPTKDVEPVEPVAESAPVIPAVEATEPLAASVASPATVPTETTDATVANGEAKTESVPKNDKRKSSLPWLNKKEKPATSDEETEKPLSPFAKLRATVKGKKAEKTSEKPAEEVPETPKEPEVPAAAEPAVPETEAVVSEPIVAAPASTAQVSATA